MLCWCALVVFGMFCFPGVTSSTISPGLASKTPERAPINVLSVVVCVAFCFRRTSGHCPGALVSFAGRLGVCMALLHRPLPVVRFSDALSAGNAARLAAPCRFTYCERKSTMVGRLPCRSALVFSLSLSLGAWKQNFPVFSLSLVCQSISLPGLPQLQPRTLNCDQPFPPPHGVSNSRQKPYLLH